MNPVPRTAMAFLFATLLSVSSYTLLSTGIIAVLVALSCSLVFMAISANAKEIRANGKSIGFTSGRLLPIAGLNFATLFTALAILVAVLHGVSQAIAA